MELSNNNTIDAPRFRTAHKNLTLTPIASDSQAERSSTDAVRVVTNQSLRVAPSQWTAEVEIVRSQVVREYTLSMPVSPARLSVDMILGDLVTQGLLLPDPKITAKGESEFKVDARIPEAVYHSEASSLIRRKFYALYRERQLFVDLRLHPQRDGE